MAYRINSGAARVPGNAWVIGPAFADHDYATNGHTSDVWHLRAARACWPALALERVFHPQLAGLLIIGGPSAVRISEVCSPVPVPAHERARASQRSH